MDTWSKCIHSGKTQPSFSDRVNEDFIVPEKWNRICQPFIASCCLNTYGTGEGSPPDFITIANGEDDSSLRVECHEILIDVTARGVDGGKITAHSALDTVITLF